MERTTWNRLSGVEMLLIAAPHVTQPMLVRAVCLNARTVLRRVPAWDGRPRRAIEVAERWCDEKATLEDVRAAIRDGFVANANEESRPALAANAAACSVVQPVYAIRSADVVADVVGGGRGRRNEPNPNTLPGAAYFPITTAKKEAVPAPAEFLADLVRPWWTYVEDVEFGRLDGEQLALKLYNQYNNDGSVRKLGLLDAGPAEERRRLEEWSIRCEQLLMRIR